MREHIYYFNIHVGRQLLAGATSTSHRTVLLLFLALVIIHETERLFIYVCMQSGVIVRGEAVIYETIDKLSLPYERGAKHSDTVSSHLLRLLTLAS
jgi:hypothetical protein